MSKLNIAINNLGQVEKGVIKIRPLTIITGENGTGKSMVAKTLYSVFHSANESMSHPEKEDETQISRYTALSRRSPIDLEDNFQIHSTGELVTSGKSEISISAKGLEVNITSGGNVVCDVKAEFFESMPKLPGSVVFFDSTPHWDVRSILHNHTGGNLLKAPRYLYELGNLVHTKKHRPVLKGVQKLAEDLKKEISGELIFKNNELLFVDTKGREISANLLSSGTISLGLFQALLRSNTLIKDSFLFFDNPETSLHPDMQVVLTKILIKLSECGVNVVMTTHSLHMVKALEVTIDDKEDSVAAHVAVNHFENGTIDNGSDEITKDLIKSRNRLMDAYDKLFFSELYDGQTNEHN